MDDQLDLYSDLDITDNDLVAENPELVVRTSGIVGKIVALFLGLIIGFGACVGTFLMMLNYTSVGYGIDMLSGFTGLTFDDAVENKLISEKSFPLCLSINGTNQIPPVMFLFSVAFGL